eukprot:GHVR01091584.1.p1 GENE.GHVR01091584.1~~GHVR01091584.1.p1  ORF type:complete len:239 (+),score=109.76 GHVR01091584.1:264-980(+)
MARVCLGVGIGGGLAVPPMYIAELSPAHVRGRLSSLTEYFIVVGVLLGFLCAWVFDWCCSEWLGAWRAMLGVGCIPASLILVFIVCLPESPRWLVMKGRDREARDVLVRLYKDHVIADMILNEWKESIPSKRECTDNLCVCPCVDMCVCPCVDTNDTYPFTRMCVSRSCFSKQLHTHTGTNIEADIYIHTHTHTHNKLVDMTGVHIKTPILHVCDNTHTKKKTHTHTHTHTHTRSWWT